MWWLLLQRPLKSQPKITLFAPNPKRIIDGGPAMSTKLDGKLSPYQIISRTVCGSQLEFVTTNLFGGYGLDIRELMQFREIHLKFAAYLMTE
jgi:hypothetical protein